MRYFATYILVLLWVVAAQATAPIFENRTPVGFLVQDSTTTADFVAGGEVGVRVDLNQEATIEYPLVGHFHNLEISEQIGTTATDGMQVDIAMVDVVPFGVNDNFAAPGVTSSATLHMAWIEQTGTSAGSTYSGGITPVYQVKYARSFDKGATFSSSTTISGGINYHPLSTSIAGTGASFSTLDLEVDSGGNPRVAFAFVSTADAARNRNVLFNYSQDGGQTWQSSPVRINNLSQTEGQNCAFPRMVIDDRDNIFITYVRGATLGSTTDDVMLAKINRATDPFTTLPLGETGSSGSGGVRLAPNGERQTGPDLAVGDGDALHLVYYNDGTNRIEHRRMATDTTWVDVSTTGWNQDAAGALVSTFDNSSATNAALEVNAIYYFPSIVVDRQRLPDRVYSIFKFGDNTPAEGIYFNNYDETGTMGTGNTWNTATSLWNTATPALFADGTQNYNIELDWEITERVAVIADDRLEDDRGDLHIAFTAGYSSGNEHDVYYARYNGSSWTLPEKVADDDSDAATQDGIAATDVFLLSPALVQPITTASDNLFLVFAGGTAEGFGLGGVTNVNHHAYFKVLGRDITSEDVSRPVGAFEYILSYTPVNPHSEAATVANQLIYVHAADPTNGASLGASGASTDGFLAGEWETVGASLADDDKSFEGKVNEDSNSTNEWGDDDDKINLLVKLNVLGSDSATNGAVPGNVQLVTNSTASAAGTGLGARTVTVGVDPSASFVAVGSFFILGADIDIVTSNSVPTVSITDPDGSGDTANASYAIRYDLQDADDDLNSLLQAALYFYPTKNLKSVRDIRIFGTLIVDQNDNSSNNSNGTDDFAEGTNESYTWDDPPDALESAALYASILRATSGDYYIYIVADDQKNPPVFAVSPGAVTLRHSPIVQQVDPIAADTVDSGVRTGLKASPYDLDFAVFDYDSEARVQLFYASVAGITSVSATGVYPNQKFVLGKSVAGTRGTAITDSTTLTSRDHEFSWDVSSPLVAEGSHYLYAVGSDSISASVGNSSTPLVVRHSPSFTFYEPPQDTQREIDTGSQSIYTIQWQKGPGVKDLDHNADIDLYFTTDDPAVTDHSTESGASTTSLTLDADTKKINVAILPENSTGAGDMFAWDLRSPPNAVPTTGQSVWIYAVVTDGNGNITVARGGSLVMTHSPYILLETRLPEVNQGDIVRLEWDDYLVDDGSTTDNAYIRLYASPLASHTTLQALEIDILGGAGEGNTIILNSSDGTATGTITNIREADGNSFNWDTLTDDLSVSPGIYTVYAGISTDATFSDNATGRVSTSSNIIKINTYNGTQPNMGLSPNKVAASPGDTLTFEVLLQSDSKTIESITAVLDLGTNLFSVINSGSPFTDLGVVFSGGTVVENATSGTKLSFSKNKPGGEVVGTTTAPLRLASFQVVAQNGLSGVRTLKFDDDTAFGILSSTVPLKKSTGMSLQNARVQSLPRGRLQAAVLLEGRSNGIGSGNHSTLLDVHLRLPGSTIDITDAIYIGANDDHTATTDTVEIQTSSSGALLLSSIPAGRYVLTVKDTSHLSGRTDTLTIRNGDNLILSSTEGFFASDIRGDPSFLLGQEGRTLKAGDVTEDNEIDEDDINTIDAAWGTDASKSNFKQADLNNDNRVGVEDLTVTSSNISNSTGFGAPPVFKRVGLGGNVGAGLEIVAPSFAGEWRQGVEIELVFLARDLGDLAGYGFDLSYDEADMELLDRGVAVAEVFGGNPKGYFQRFDGGAGRISVAGARRGKEWSAVGEGELLRLRVRLHRDGFPQSLQLEGGTLLSSQYEVTELRLRKDPALLAIPQEFNLGPNYPNPFNPTTTIPFNVPALDLLLGQVGARPVSVMIYNSIGQQVRTLVDGAMRPGYYRAEWDGVDGGGRGVGSGMYFYRVQVGGQARVGKMTLLK